MRDDDIGSKRQPMRLSVKLLAYLEDRSPGQTVSTNVAAVEV